LMLSILVAMACPMRTTLILLDISLERIPVRDWTSDIEVSPPARLGANFTGSPESRDHPAQAPRHGPQARSRVAAVQRAEPLLRSIARDASARPRHAACRVGACDAAAALR
jgi:hypothetical protein